MSFLQNIKFSNLTLIAGVFFAAVILSACGGDSDERTITSREPIPHETAYQTPASLASFETTEYKESKASSGIKAAYAYGNIQALVDADTSGTVKQGGEGQIVSIVSTGSFATWHQEFDSDGTLVSDRGDGAAFDAIYVASHGTDGMLYETNADILDNAKGNCTDVAICSATAYAALIAGRKDEIGIHGIAHKAKLRGMQTAISGVQLTNTLQQGVGANIIAMNHIWDDETVTACSSDRTIYIRPKGKNISARACDGTITNSAPLIAGDLDAWEKAVSATNNTIMVFGAGDNGFNSETGQATIEGTSFTIDAVLATGSAENANIPAFRAAYPALYDEDDLDTDDVDEDFTSDKWLVVTALDKDNVILAEANGCGVAMHFCLAAPGQNIASSGSNRDGTTEYISDTDTKFASSSVAGALAVLKGAFPSATPEQLTRLVLDTATYIPLDGRDNDSNLLRTRTRRLFFTEDLLNRKKVLRADGSTRYVNPVYGYGLLNLAAASTPSVTSSYVTASNNESIGVLWQDTSLTLSEAFGSNFEAVSFGIGDVYGRHFTTKASQVNHTPVAVGLDDYMSNLLGENVQSQKLGPQAQVNYSNSEQSWMNLEYKAGKATSKIAFQESYKINPLSDSNMGATSQATKMLRANHIRPASENIGMMDVDYQLTRNLSLSSYAARGEYDTGYRFDELGTDIDVRYNKSTLNIGLGNLREHDQFLGTNTTGAYSLREPSVSRFTDVTYGHDVGEKFNIYANYIQYKTDVDMGYQQFATIDNLQADQYQVGFKGKDLISDDDNLNVALITKLGVTDGVLNQNTVLGYTEAGGFNNVSQSYDLAVDERHQQFEITYQGRLYQNADKVSKLRDNRFFTTIRVDQNLNNVHGASQTEIIGGINARF